MPAGASSEEAATFLIRLLKSGQLPDVENGAHLDFHFKQSETNYPMSRTFNLRMKNHDPFVNHYTVVKISDSSPWQLKKAWRTDAKGKTVTVYPIP
jgi:hypothetical protein